MIEAQLGPMMDELRNISTPPISNNLRSRKYGLVFHANGMRDGTSSSPWLSTGPSTWLKTGSKEWAYLLFLKISDERTKPFGWEPAL
jgi:hypothetical protein